MVIGCVTLAGSLAAQQPKKSSFLVTINGKMTVKAGPQSQNLVTKTTFAYTLMQEKRKYQVQLDSADLVVTVEGRVAMSAVLNKDYFENRMAKTKVKSDDAPASLKQMLQDSYGTPIFEFEVDENFRETKSKAIGGEGSKETIRNGQVANARMFHQPFHADKKSWKAKVKYALGEGNYATGELTFEKLAAKGDIVPVKVSGTLTPSGKQRNLEIRNGKYEVSGTQNFHRKNKEYESGQQDIQVSFELFQGDNKVVENSGKMTLILKKTK